MLGFQQKKDNIAATQRKEKREEKKKQKTFEISMKEKVAAINDNTDLGNEEKIAELKKLDAEKEKERQRAKNVNAKMDSERVALCLEGKKATAMLKAIEFGMTQSWQEHHQEMLDQGQEEFVDMPLKLARWNEMRATKDVPMPPEETSEPPKKRTKKGESKSSPAKAPNPKAMGLKFPFYGIPCQRCGAQKCFKMVSKTDAAHHYIAATKPAFSGTAQGFPWMIPTAAAEEEDSAQFEVKMQFRMVQCAAVGKAGYFVSQEDKITKKSDLPTEKQATTSVLIRVPYLVQVKDLKADELVYRKSHVDLDGHK